MKRAQKGLLRVYYHVYMVILPQVLQKHYHVYKRLPCLHGDTTAGTTKALPCLQTASMFTW